MRRVLPLAALLLAASAGAAPWDVVLTRGHAALAGASVGVTPNGTAWTGGNVNSIDATYQPALVAVDSDGRLVGSWRITCDPDGGRLQGGRVTCDASGAVFVENAAGDSTTTLQPRVAKFEADGVRDWAVALGGMTGGSLFSADGQGGCWLGTPATGALVHVGADGAVVAAFTVGGVTLSSVSAAPGGGVDLGGTNPGPQQGFAARLDAIGNVQWQESITSGLELFGGRSFPDGAVAFLQRSNTGVLGCVRLDALGVPRHGVTWTALSGTASLSAHPSGEVTVASLPNNSGGMTVLRLGPALDLLAGKLLPRWEFPVLAPLGEDTLASTNLSLGGWQARSRLTRFGPRLETSLPCDGVVDAAPTAATYTPATAASPLTLTPLAVSSVPVDLQLTRIPSIGEASGAPGAGEDDDCASTMSPLRQGETKALDGCDGPADWFTLAAVAGEHYVITTRDVGSSADTRIDVLAADCVTPLASSAGSAGGETLAWTSSTDADVRIRVAFEDGVAGRDREYEVGLEGEPFARASWCTAVDGGFVQSKLAHSIARWGSGFAVATAKELLAVSSDGVIDAAESYPTVDDVSSDGDCGIVMTGRFGAGTFVQSRDDAGAIRWTCATTGTSTWWRSVQPTRDGGAYVAGLSSGPLVVARIAADGVLAWARGFPSENWVSESARVAELAGGDVVVAGCGRVSSEDCVLVARLSPAGDVRWTRTFAYGEPQLALALVMPTRDGGAIVASGRVLDLADHLDGFSYASRLDAAGHVTWSERLEGARFVELLGGASEGFDACLLTGRAEAWPPRSGDGLLLELGADGGILWQAGFDLEGELDGLDDVEIDADGSLLLAAHGCNANVGWPVIMKLDPRRRPPDGRVVASTMHVTTAPMSGVERDWTPVVDVQPVTQRSETVVPAPIALDAYEPFVGSGVPTEVSAGCASPLLFTSKTTFTWERRAPSGSRSFDAYRGRISALRAGDYGTCLASGLVGASLTDPELPGLADGFFYLVGGRNASGDGPITCQLPRRWMFPTTPCP